MQDPDDAQRVTLLDDGKALPDNLYLVRYAQEEEERSTVTVKQKQKQKPAAGTSYDVEAEDFLDQPERAHVTQERVASTALEHSTANKYRCAPQETWHGPDETVRIHFV
jgi:LysM repeat protein